VRREGQEQLRVIPITWKAAVAFVNKHHRHHSGARGQKWAIGAKVDGYPLWGVAQCGRPVSRVYDDGFTCEVNRTCTPGFPNVNSFLYGACWRIARAMGYHTSITYTEDGESGVSLKACGYRRIRRIEARPGWADSSVKMKAKRDPVGTGGVVRFLWALSTKPWKEVLERFKGDEYAG
jgi:hypothetical protein